MKRIENNQNTSFSGSIIAILFLALCTAGCIPWMGCSDHSEGDHDHNEAEEGHEDEGHHQEKEGVVEIDAVTATRIGLVTGTVQKEKIHSRFSLPGIVQPQGDAIAHVGTIVPGRVIQLHASEGEYVTKGKTIAEIETLEIGKARAEYLNARAQEEQTRRGLERQQRLAGEQIGAERTLEAAQADYDRALAARKEAEAHLRSFGINPAQASSSFANRMRITAPISGMISDRAVTLGEYVDLADNLFTIVNTGTVWIEAKSTPSQAASLAVGSPAVVRGPLGERVSGTVIFISPVVDPESKSVTIRFAVPNQRGVFRPGTFVTAEFPRGEGSVGLVVPVDALEREGGHIYIYREEEPGHFQRVEVEVEEEREDRAILGAGVEEGDRIAVQGVFYLRSIRSAGELEEHHH